ncbi:hypothetical protein BD414DRAFT_89412 [Trametes punicea]|nr:hypothetical protein BD414DRAFT_89412 [Trametes punicea]
MAAPLLDRRFFFYETFDNLGMPDDPSALGVLTYMLLCKVVLHLSTHAELRDVACMRAVARAHQERNRADFEKTLGDYRPVSF